MQPAPSNDITIPGVEPQIVSLVRPVGQGPHPAAKRLPCACMLRCREPHDGATQTIRFIVDRSACTMGHKHEEPGARTTYCACVLHTAPAEGVVQEFVIDFSRCTARSVPVPPSAFPRP